MEIVKKNLVSIICAVVAILAVVASFYPLGHYFDDVNTKLAKRKVQYSAIESLTKKPRTWPVIDPFNPTKTPLPWFPTRPDIRHAEGMQKSLVGLSQAVSQKALDLNMAQFRIEGAPDPRSPHLLVANLLPVPPGEAPFIFKGAWANELKLVRERILRSGTPPLDKDIEAALAALRKKWDSRLERVGDKVQNQDYVDASYNREAADLPEQMRTERAKSVGIYIEPDVLVLPSAIETSANALSVDRIWFAQLSLWISEDICRAIRQANGDRSVIDAPVKRLVKLDVGTGSDVYVGEGLGGVMGEGGGNSPASARLGGGAGGEGANASGPPTKNVALSPTGRVCNNVYDVVHFTLVVDVEEAAIPQFLKQLCAGRLTTVRKVELVHVDGSSMTEQGFIYGPNPVSQITIDGESLLLRQWTTKLMPKMIKQLLGVDNPQAGRPGSLQPSADPAIMP